MPTATTANPTDSQFPAGKRPVNWWLVALFLTISIGGTYLAIWMRPKPQTPRYIYKVLNTYPHDNQAFTQGLQADGEFLWESTGLNGKSGVRKTDLKTGEVLQETKLDEKYFGEGLVWLSDKLYQLTWKAGRGFIYDRELNKIGKFDYDGHGWGLATDGQHLIISDGTPEIRFLDPETFAEVRSIWVRRAGSRVGQLNELEVFGIKPKLYANVYLTDLIYEISLKTGDVTAIIDLKGLWPISQRPRDGVLNGIAVHPESNKMLVTGKLCPHVWEIQLLPVE